MCTYRHIFAKVIYNTLFGHFLIFPVQSLLKSFLSYYYGNTSSMSLDYHKSCVLRIHFFGNDEININENHIIFNKVRAYIRQSKRLLLVVVHLVYININLFPMFHYIVLNIIYIYVCARLVDIIVYYL